MLEKITQDELLLVECLSYPISASECVFSDLENLATEPLDQLAHIRTGQIPMLSFEHMLDEDPALTKQENFKLKEGAGNIDAFAGRLLGKTLIVEVIDILLSIPWIDYEVGFTSVDAVHIRAILEDKLIPVLMTHPFYKMFLLTTAGKGITRSPNYRISLRNGYTLLGINMNVQSKNPGKNFFGLHLKRLYVEEASLETEDVYNKRLDSKSEMGCVIRSGGMTNFTKYSPAGKRFYNAKNKPWVYNVPQYINPMWNDEQRDRAIERHGGESSVGYRIFVKGEIVEEGISVFDMERVRRNYLENKIIKSFEITKKSFHNLQHIIILDRPESVETVYVAGDIGETAPTEIMIFFKSANKYKYVYNITAYNLTHKQQFHLFSFIAKTVKADIVALDTTDGLGRAIYRDLLEVFPENNLVSCGFNESIPVGFEKTEKGDIVLKDGNPVYKEELVSEWTVTRLRTLLYEEKISLPLDYKLDQQLNLVVAEQRASRIIYQVMSGEDHLFAAFRVFALAEWKKEFSNLNPIKYKKFAKVGC